MADTRFRKGQVPWNKGTIGVMKSNSGSFKMGQAAHNKKESIEKTCKCGKVFYVKPSLDRVQSCSRKCGHSGKTTSDKQKMAARKQAKNLPKFKKGHTPWNKGMIGFMAGENHYNWKGGGTKLERQLFRDRMQKMVFERDDYTCQLCGERGGKLQVDHIQSWSEYVELRFNLDNCRTLCMACHYEITFNKPMPSEQISWGHNLKHVGVKERI